MQQPANPSICAFEVGVAACHDAAVQEHLPSPGASSPYGYDVQVDIKRATNLPGMDWHNGLADPYVIVTVTAPDQSQILRYRTGTVWKDLNPELNEYFKLGNLQEGSRLACKVYDKDLVGQNDFIGGADWEFTLQQQQQQAQAPQPSPSGGREVRLQLQHPTEEYKTVGQLDLEVKYHPSAAPGAPRMLGPVRYRQHLSPRAGWLMRNWNDDDSMAYVTTKLYLCHIASTFAGVRCPWNRAYDKAASLFGNPVLLAGVRSQHATLYATQLGSSRAGVLRSAEDFFALFNHGVRDGERRYFTYTLLADSLRCSETGAGFFTDFMSKHAMHGGGEEEVLYAGEFCIVPDEAAVGGHRLVIDNNSGTFAPGAEHLPLMRQLFTSNFPTMSVETVPAGDPRLDLYHQRCPSRTAA